MGTTEEEWDPGAPSVHVIIQATRHDCPGARHSNDAATSFRGANSRGTMLWALTKGAPEALAPLLDAGLVPLDYEAAYRHHMVPGCRVPAPVNHNIFTQQ